LLYLTDKIGYGKWAEIKKAIKRDVRCRFDHLFMSRAEDDLKKRVIYLVQCIEKELEDDNNFVPKGKYKLVEIDQ
jgi:putative lipoic acid-binding regulatory protein